jgi:hypothetical protein
VDPILAIGQEQFFAKLFSIYIFVKIKMKVKKYKFKCPPNGGFHEIVCSRLI